MGKARGVLKTNAHSQTGASSSMYGQIVEKSCRCLCFSPFLWTNSTSVLMYIKNKTFRFRIFVANRVSKILNELRPAQWRCVNTLSNPAEIASGELG